eukprot:Mycagemm_TRINITY_DN10309_c3_g8::TRINITY_DN10309_c3_g8_i1::g.530::m.530 type:complete len:103 gc:universal TRINITY_DN10309_c3_g8_i1:248-556(+)
MGGVRRRVLRPGKRRGRENRRLRMADEGVCEQVLRGRPRRARASAPRRPLHGAALRQLGSNTGGARGSSRVRRRHDLQRVSRGSSPARVGLPRRPRQAQPDR